MAHVIDPTPESFRALSQDVPADVPVVMLNLLRFREAAAYPDGSAHEPCSGRAAYGRYSAHALPAVAAAGGQVLFAGQALAHPIGLPEERWDEVVLVAYPSIGAFFKMVMEPAYQAQSVHRTAALLDARLVCTRRS
jgi:uncharacterized protein (DUF1330 family)